MQLVTPSVVPTAVSTAIITCKIVFQTSFFIFFFLSFFNGSTISFFSELSQVFPPHALSGRAASDLLGLQPVLELHSKVQSVFFSG